MREMKFKVLDKRNNKIIGSFDLYHVSNFDAMMLMELSGKEVEYLQYTGLKDRNGKDIYVGDVIRFWDIRKQKRWIQEVIFSVRGMFCPKQLAIPLGAFEIRDIKVIGNIYENPELLEEQ